jgi:predicted ABC-type ATPase
MNSSRSSANKSKSDEASQSRQRFGAISHRAGPSGQSSRVQKARADAGEHSASETTLRRIHAASLANLPRAILEADQLWVYDNTKPGGPLQLVLEAESGNVNLMTARVPAWLASAVLSA